MIKAFLSHSKADKGRYVKIVADKLGVNNCVYDDYTFEAGMKPLEEILRGLDSSQLFVVFISEPALKSEWVKTELLQAHKRLEEGLLKRIYPIIIDKNITHSDSRIPQWMQDDYNLKYVSKPTIAVRRIRQRLREISWELHPRIKARENLFVGRNEQLKLLEERLDDINKGVPNCIIASGLPRVGKSTILQHGLKKANLERPSYEFPSIVLRRSDSIEGLLLKLYDLGFSDVSYPVNLMSLSVQERVDILIDIVRDIQKVREKILIHDDNCLVTNGKVQNWFKEICQKTSGDNITFLVASRTRPFPEDIRHRDYLYALEVPELTYPERCGLLKRLLGVNDLVLSKDNFMFFSRLQYGLPDQVRYTCDLIEDFGVEFAKKKSHLIQEFNSNKAEVFLSKYNDDQKALDLLYLLSELDLISFTFLYSIVPQEECQRHINGFIATAVCNFFGVEKEYIHLNDSIRDYVRRNRLGIPDIYKDKLDQHFKKFLMEEDKEDRDISDFLYSIKLAIKRGKRPPKKYLIPAHFLNSMRELYQERDHVDRVIELADTILEKPHMLDPIIASDIRYYLCLALARKRDSRLLHEVHKISGPQHDFILGFYYRLKGRPQDAIDRFNNCLSHPSVSSSAKRELVQVYRSLDDFKEAASLAKSNYEENPRNPYHIQAYFESLINTGHPYAQRELLLSLIEELDSIKSDIAHNMTLIARAEFEAKCNDDYQAALEQLQIISKVDPQSHYPLLTKAKLAARQGDINTLRKAIKELRKLQVDKNTIIRLEAYDYALSGELEKAVSLVQNNLKGYPPFALDSLISRLHQMEKPKN